jgi:RimJ/RimL family protein N-acetyltransferase
MQVLRTSRLVLRGWRDADRDAMAALNADPEVMRHFPSTLDRQQSDAFVDRHLALLEERGWGLWAVEVPGVAHCIGFVGLSEATFAADFTPALEVGWRLAREHWGRGYAPEGAAAALDFAFDALHNDEIVSFTAVGNDKSRRVMEKLGFSRDPADDFDHPNVPEGDPLRRHVVYRLLRTNRPGRAPVGLPSS